MKVLINTLHPLDFWNIPEIFVGKAEKRFPDITFVYLKDKSNLQKEIEDADVYFGWFPGEEAFLKAKKLKWIHTPQVGVGRFLSLGEFLEKVVLTNASNVDRRQIGEFAFSLFLGLHFGHNLIVKNYLLKKWARKEIGDFLVNPKRKPLKEMNAVVLGYGGIGKVIVELLFPVVKTVSVVKRKKENLPYRVFTLSEWRKFLPSADVVFIAIPSDKQSKGFLNREKIEIFENFPYIVNVGRGKVVVEKDIAEGLRNGKISGYAADVCEVEPPDENFPLWGFDNVIISPHVSALEPDFWKKQFGFFLENLERFLNGEKPLGIVND